MDWNGIAQTHYAWVDRMGWHKATVLESLALIGSEIGEAADECLDGPPTAAFGVELADIVLRCADVAWGRGIDLEAMVAQAQDVTPRSQGFAADIAELTVDLARWVNTARKEALDAAFGLAMGQLLRRVVDVAERAGVDLAAEVQRKMQLNEIRGSRGRVI